MDRMEPLIIGLPIVLNRNNVCRAKNMSYNQINSLIEAMKNEQITQIMKRTSDIADAAADIVDAAAAAV